VLGNVPDILGVDMLLRSLKMQRRRLAVPSRAGGSCGSCCYVVVFGNGVITAPVGRRRCHKGGCIL